MLIADNINPNLELIDCPIEEWLLAPPEDWFDVVTPPSAYDRGLSFLIDGLENPPLDLRKYRHDLLGYCRDILGTAPYAGLDGHDGQVELLEAIQDSASRQMRREKNVPNIFRVESGHGLGKTRIAGSVVNWFFDCFAPSITLTTAPTAAQVNDLLWKEIKTQRTSSPHAASLGGSVSPKAPSMSRAPDHFAVGRTTSNAGGQGTARFQGQHGKYLLFVVDEAEGVADFVFDAITAMMTGGTVILVLMLANPMTRTSRFHRMAEAPNAKTFNFDALFSPNVIVDREVVPNLTGRESVQNYMSELCEVTLEHKAENFTFTVDFAVNKEGVEYPAGTIWKPDDTQEFLWRVRGIAPMTSGARAVVGLGAYLAAVERGRVGEVERYDTHQARIGVDVARMGADSGTVYIKHAGTIRRAARLAKLDNHAYVDAVKTVAMALPPEVISLHVRIDGSGGFGSGPIDMLKADLELHQRFEDFVVFEVIFNGVPMVYANAAPKYLDKITEIYHATAEVLPSLAILSPPKQLETDLTARQFEPRITKRGRTVRALVPKEKFKHDFGHSPDDGDGFVLSGAPDHCFYVPDDSDGLYRAQTISSIDMGT
jgi:hypothetical protein